MLKILKFVNLKGLFIQILNFEGSFKSVKYDESINAPEHIRFFNQKSFDGFFKRVFQKLSFD
jgi:hypothetical protein